MTEREYAADLKHAVATSPADDGSEWWAWHSHGISIELHDYDPEETQLIIFPDEHIAYEEPLCVSWLERIPDDEEAHNTGQISGALRNGARGLVEILTMLKRREAENLQAPKVLFGIDMAEDTAKFAYRRLGFYYLGKSPGEHTYVYNPTEPTEQTYEMAVATDTLTENLAKLLKKPIRGKTLFDRLEERSNR